MLYQNYHILLYFRNGIQDLLPVIRGCQNGGAIVSDCNPAHYCWERFSGSCSDATSRQQVFESPMQQL
ncbi:hypothetical protein FIBSPDRAFT_216760 [Athelia psychrophila]|uniref:Uncharacterized protein n=1 Tax=Athelia psychrophila TaxID=1759441 RepID=A0A165ZD15_9AGAM|nr:hypothetical protein FIBSPDRAFT_216760 [Fibularhizoctonia sp. CBS 109695]